MGLPDDLKLADWIKTCDYFQWLCAYCQEIRIEVLEHFVPITHGGGTVVSNCVPACASCNQKKMYVHPDKVRKIPRGDIERVRQYLATVKTVT